MTDHLKLGMFLYASVSNAIGRELGSARPPEIDVAYGRTTLIFRNQGASRWTEAEQVDNALQTASIARRVLAEDSRRAMRQRARRAIVVVYEDTSLERGCEVISRWECVVPARVTSA